MNAPEDACDLSATYLECKVKIPEEKVLIILKKNKDTGADGVTAELFKRGEQKLLNVFLTYKLEV